MSRQRSTAVHVAGREIDMAWEGNNAYTLYSICEVLHRNEHGQIDYYRRLYAYDWQRSKKDACKVLAEIKASGVVREYKEQRLYRRQKYFVCDTGRKARDWGVETGTVYFFIEAIDDPYKQKSHQCRTRYQGPALDTLEPKDYCDCSKITAIAKQLDDVYWQEYKASMTPRVEIVDRRCKQ